MTDEHVQFLQGDLVYLRPRIQEGIQKEGYYCHFAYSDFIMMRILRREA